jgi:hypothetical protein
MKTTETRFDLECECGWHRPDVPEHDVPFACPDCAFPLGIRRDLAPRSNDSGETIYWNGYHQPDATLADVLENASGYCDLHFEGSSAGEECRCPPHTIVVERDGCAPLRLTLERQARVGSIAPKVTVTT